MLLIILFTTGLLAGTVDAIAGGGGLISLPVLLGLGIPPHLAFGTNKLQGTLGTFIATRRYYRQGWISLETVYIGVIFGLAGSIAGAVLGQALGSDILKKIIPVLLMLILIYTLFSPRLGIREEKPRVSEYWFYIIFGFVLGFYDGFFGPGVGSFWVFLLTFFLGYSLIKATAYTKLFNFNSSFIAMICFGLGGNIDYKIGLCMAAGQLIGGRLGANLAIKNGARLIRPLFLSVVTMTIATLTYRTYLRSDLMIRFANQYSLLPKVLIVISLFMGLLFAYLKINRSLKN